MITIADTIAPECVALGLTASDHNAAIQHVAELLKNMPQVLDWEALYAGLKASSPCLTEAGEDFAICLPHARTDAVDGMVISVGRFDHGIHFPTCSPPIRYVFCIGVPKALANDYLRILGLIARILKDPKAESRLNTAETPADFVRGLSELEAKV